MMFDHLKRVPIWTREWWEISEDVRRAMTRTDSDFFEQSVTISIEEKLIALEKIYALHCQILDEWTTERPIPQLFKSEEEFIEKANNYKARLLSKITRLRLGII